MNLPHNPVYTGDFADPYCFQHEGAYYAITTGHGSHDIDPATKRTIRMIKSTDMKNWQPVGHVLHQPEEEFGSCYWAPEIAVSNGKFYLYYAANGAAVKTHSTDNYFRIRVAVADHPEGPYIDTGTALTDYKATNNFAIDASPFQDRDGQWYLYYARDFYDSDGTTFRGTALEVDRLIDMTRLAGQPQQVMRAHWSWQVFTKNRNWAGKVQDWYTLEGPFVLRQGDTYYMFYSGGCWENETYGVDFLTATHPMGPWTEHGKDRGPQVTRTIPGYVRGPGHNSVVRSPKGDPFIVYHAWNEAMTARELWIDPLAFTTNGPRVERFTAHIAAHPVAKG